MAAKREHVGQTWALQVADPTSKLNGCYLCTCGSSVPAGRVATAVKNVTLATLFDSRDDRETKKKFFTTALRLQVVAVDVNAEDLAAAAVTKETADAFWNACQQAAINLYSRWMDEREYENIADYKLPLDKIAEEHRGVTVVVMTKRPFGFKFMVGGAMFHATVTSRTYNLKRLS